MRQRLQILAALVAITPLDDLYRFDRALRSGVLLSRASVEEMFATKRGQSAGAWVVSDSGARRSMTINTRAPHSTADDLASVALGHDRISPAPQARVIVPADKVGKRRASRGSEAECMSRRECQPNDRCADKRTADCAARCLEPDCWRDTLRWPRTSTERFTQ